jgi:flagellar hook-associated protein 3 FlgL
VRVQRPSDDPVAAAGILQSSSGLRALEQYKTNLQAGLTRLQIEDSVLDQVGNALTHARELAVAAASDPATPESRDAAHQELLSSISFVQELANIQFNGTYVFGGQYADTAPFQGGTWDPARPPAGTTRLEIGSGQFADTNHSAQEIFIDSDVVDALDALGVALDANDVPGIQAALTRIDAAMQNVQELVGNLGGRMNRFDHSLSNLDSLEVTLQTFRSDLSDADLAEAVTQLVNRQGALEAAMLANARILDTTLADYLR